MTNPFEPPSQLETPAPDPQQSFEYAGGSAGVTGIAIAGGLVAGLAIAATFNMGVAPAYVVPAITWICTFTTLFCFARPIKSWGWRIGTAITLTLPCYVLYVPLCSFTAAMSMDVVGTQAAYTPLPFGIVLASVLAFLVLLPIFASIIRAQQNRNSRKNT